MPAQRRCVGRAATSSAASGRRSSSSCCCSCSSATPPGRGSPSGWRSSPPWSGAWSARSRSPHCSLVGDRRCWRSSLVAVPARRCTSTCVTAVGFDDWGGLMLNLFLAVGSIILCFPLGVLLALGRRSRLPLIRVDVHRVHRDLPRRAAVRAAAAGQRRPRLLRARRARAPEPRRGRSSCSRCSPRPTSPRSSAAGCSRCPRGQTEAAKALGLSPVRQTCFIVLPQALRNVIPRPIGQFISLFKDTTLAGAAMGLLDLLNVSEAVTAQDAVPGAGPDRRDAGVRRAAVLGRLRHDEPREPAARTQAGSRRPMSDARADADVFADATQIGGTAR